MSKSSLALARNMVDDHLERTDHCPIILSPFSTGRRCLFGQAHLGATGVPQFFQPHRASREISKPGSKNPGFQTAARVEPKFSQLKKKILRKGDRAGCCTEQRGQKLYKPAFFAHPSFLLSKIIVSTTPDPYLAIPSPCSGHSTLLDLFEYGRQPSSILPPPSTLLATHPPRYSTDPLTSASSSSPAFSLAALRNHLIKSISDSTCSIACHLIQSSR